jgi:hypothetical protein
MSGAKDKATEPSASILARKSGKLNPPYAGCHVAANATYKVGVMPETRWAAQSRDRESRQYAAASPASQHTKR